MKFYDFFRDLFQNSFRPKNPLFKRAAAEATAEQASLLSLLKDKFKHSNAEVTSEGIKLPTGTFSYLLARKDLLIFKGFPLATNDTILEHKTFKDAMDIASSEFGKNINITNGPNSDFGLKIWAYGQVYGVKVANYSPGERLEEAERYVAIVRQRKAADERRFVPIQTPSPELDIPPFPVASQPFPVKPPLPEKEESDQGPSCPVSTELYEKPKTEVISPPTDDPQLREREQANETLSGVDQKGRDVTRDEADASAERETAPDSDRGSSAGVEVNSEGERQAQHAAMQGDREVMRSHVELQPRMPAMNVTGSTPTMYYAAVDLLRHQLASLGHEMTPQNVDHLMPAQRLVGDIPHAADDCSYGLNTSPKYFAEQALLLDLQSRLSLPVAEKTKTLESEAVVAEREVSPVEHPSAPTRPAPEDRAFEREYEYDYGGMSR